MFSASFAFCMFFNFALLQGKKRQVLPKHTTHAKMNSTEKGFIGVLNIPISGMKENKNQKIAKTTGGDDQDFVFSLNAKADSKIPRLNVTASNLEKMSVSNT